MRGSLALVADGRGEGLIKAITPPIGAMSVQPKADHIQTGMTVRGLTIVWMADSRLQPAISM